MVRPNETSSAYESFRERWEKRKGNREEIYEDEDSPKVIAVMLEELEAARLDELMEEVTVHEAVETTGFSEDTIRRKLDAGDVRNVGSSGSVRTRAAELPYRAGRAHPAALRRRLYGEFLPPASSGPSTTSAWLEPAED